MTDDALDHRRTVIALGTALGAIRPTMFVMERNDLSGDLAVQLARQGLALTPIPPVSALRADLDRADGVLRERAAESWFGGETP